MDNSMWILNDSEQSFWNWYCMKRRTAPCGSGRNAQKTLGRRKRCRQLHPKRKGVRSISPLRLGPSQAFPRSYWGWCADGCGNTYTPPLSLHCFYPEIPPPSPVTPATYPLPPYRSPPWAKYHRIGSCYICGVKMFPQRQSSRDIFMNLWTVWFTCVSCSSNCRIELCVDRFHETFELS